MSNLPPYSTYRTDARQPMFPQATSHGNILTFTPPGFNQQLNVKFPDSRLAVCEKCKKNFKTRDMCRVRNTHTNAPWTTAYICITIDETCTDENGAYIDKPLTVRMVQWQPFCVKKPFDSKTPVCAACKRTNRTRSFCRERHKHKQLPWCTVYVILSALETTDPSTVVAGASKKVEHEDGDDDEGGDKPPAVTATDSGTPTSGEEGSKAKQEDATLRSETITSDGGDDGDDINEIPDSRTFLAKVSCRSTSVHWLELSDYDASEAAPFPGAVAPEAQHYHALAHPTLMDPNQQPSQYYPQQMGYTAQQQHQVSLQNRQQYFFQVQQQTHQNHQPHYAQQAHWPPHHAYMMPGKGDTQSGATAGEAAAAQQRRGHPGPPDDAHQQWALYYQAAQGPPVGHYGMHPHEPAPPPAMTSEENGDHYHSAQQDANGDSDEPDSKRTRVV